MQVFLTWNMAQNIQVSDPDLYRVMKTTMMRSLQQSVLMKQYALENNIPIRFHGHGPNEPVNYCMVCEEEVDIHFCTHFLYICRFAGFQHIFCERA